MKRLVLVLAVFSLFATDASARRRGQSYSYSYSSASLTNKIDTEKKLYNNTLSLQDIAYIRAAWMAHFESLDHGIHNYHKNCPPWPRECRGEGIGSGRPKCGTCVVGSVVVADAEARGKSGRTYRVRFFK